MNSDAEARCLGLGLHTEMNQFQANLSVSFLSITSPSEDSPSQDLPDYELLSKARFSLGTDLVELAPLKTLSLQIQQASPCITLILRKNILFKKCNLASLFWLPSHSLTSGLPPQHAADVLPNALLNLQQEDD